MGTKLSSAGDAVFFTWDIKHPWATQMASSGVQLFAEYSTRQQGRVIEKLYTARPASATLHEVALHLPSTLQGVPLGNVCLFLQVSGGKRIPLRKPSASQPDTEHFALPAWSAAVSSSTASHSHQAKLEALQAATGDAQTRISAQEKALADKGWTSEASCNNVKLPNSIFVPVERPGDVFPAEQHQGQAELVCMRRLLSVHDFFLTPAPSGETKDMTKIAYALPDPSTQAMLIQYLRTRKGVDADNLRLREQQFLQYKAAWQKWASIARDQNGRSVTPSYGRLHDELSVQAVTAEVGYEILDFSNPAAPAIKLSPPPAIQDVAGYLGGGLETYTRCVADGQKELAAKLKAWNEQLARAPVLEGMAKTQLRTQCLGNFADLAKSKEQLGALQRQLTAEQAAPEPQSHSTALPANSSLNSAVCAVP